MFHHVYYEKFEYTVFLSSKPKICLKMTNILVQQTRISNFVAYCFLAYENRIH